MIAGIGIALVAAVCYEVGYVLQVVDARRGDSDRALRASLLVWLARRRLWLAGTALTLVGVGLQTAALLWAPHTVVQPTLALGLVLMVALARRRLHEHVTLRDRLAVGAVIVGVAGVAL